MKSIQRCVVASIVATAMAVSSLPGQQLPDDLDAYIETVREAFGVVGMAVAVVKDGDVAYARGFGLRELGSSARVDEATLFAIGSNTKAFTAAGLGILVDEGRMGWDDRVTEHLPAFVLFDPYVTREITVRDLLSHRSGLGRRGDLNWYGTDFDRDEVVRRIRYLEPNSSFRSQAGYQNTMFLVAGEVTEAVSGMAWEDWIASRILQPLGMRRSVLSVDALDGVENVAAPHATIDGEVVRVPHRDIDNIAPAGSILSSVGEMTRWMRMMLGEGELEGTRILSENVVQMVWTPNIMYPIPRAARALMPSTHFSTYGMGWGLRDYRGRLIAGHSGGIDGMLSRVTLVPEEELGIVVLTNTSPAGGSAHGAVTNHILDAYLGADGERDWLQIAREQYDAQRAQADSARIRRDSARVLGTAPSLSPDAYAGVYEDRMYGEAHVTLEGGGLVLRRHTQWVADLEHWHYDTFLATWRDRYLGESLVTFRLGSGGAVEALSMGFAEFQRRNEPTNGAR